MVDGRLRRPPPGQASRLRAEHVVGVVDVAHMDSAGDGSPLARSANRVRGALDRGARMMTPLDRSLYLGFIVGDDRGQPRAVVDQFRASGLSHLTAVSGENVAFLLAVAGPLLRRLRVSVRWLATLALIGWFATLTRFEPSVLRASVMAALAATGVATGRRAAPIRLLALAVVVTLLVDPLLVHSVGWWLSVGATAGIALLALPLAARLPGPHVVRAALAVTVAAQLGVAPVSVAVFGPLPLASIPANLLAVPAAGPVMIYGLPAGLVAAVLPDPAARLVQLPTIVLVHWIARVAAWGSTVRLPRLGPLGLAAFAAAVACVLRRRPRHRQQSGR
jgi:competence protein ComEC